MKKEKIKQAGITLIALVITIVVLLILAGVSLTLVLSKQGIVTKAQDAKENYLYARSEEQATLNGADEWIDEKINGKVSRKGLAVGDYINYTPDTASAYTTLTLANTGTSSNSASVTQDSLTWQILKINDDGSMDLIGSPTSQDIYFSGATGYNNGVYLMNDICKSLYSKNSAGITARSVSLEDFEYWLNKSTGGVAARDSYSFGTVTYNTSKQYTGSSSYRPDIFGKTENESDAYYTSPTTNTYSGGESSDTLDVKQTYYNIAINETNYGEGYKALTSSTSAWMASRFGALLFEQCELRVALF